MTLSLRVMALDILSGLSDQECRILLSLLPNLLKCLLFILLTGITVLPLLLHWWEQRKQSKIRNHRGDEEYNYFMAVCFPANQLTVIDYNRVVKNLNGLTPEQFLAGT